MTNMELAYNIFFRLAYTQKFDSMSLGDLTMFVLALFV